MKLISSTKLIHNFLKEIQDLNEDISDVLLTLWGPDHSTTGDRAKTCKMVTRGNIAQTIPSDAQVSSSQNEWKLYDREE